MRMVTLADVEAARDAAARASRSRRRWRSRAGSPRSSAARCCSSARTSSAPARSRSAAPTCGCRGSRRRSGPRGVVAASAGNHAQGVALAAQMLGIKATVFMPEGAPIPKDNATRGYGAEVVFHGAHPRRGARRGAIAFADETGAVLIHPFDHADIVAGQGDVRPRDRSSRRRTCQTVLVPTGGGGLLAGIALGDQGAPPRRPGDRRAGRGRRGVPRLARGRGTRSPLASMTHDGRRHRGRPARATCRSPRSRATSTRSSPSPRSRSRGRSCCCSSAPRWWSSRPAPSASRRCSTSRTGSRPRRSRCSPAATSTRCCSAR